MGDPSIHRFRRVVESAYTHLESRRQEINDLNVFPVADGDTGDNMAQTMRAVLAELDRLEGEPLDTLNRDRIVKAVARAALMGARGNSGVILSQIVRGTAEELASRPGELVDPQLVNAALGNAVRAAYDSINEPAEGTMLTVLREMHEAISRRLAHMPETRLGVGATADEQDALLAQVMGFAVDAGDDAVERTTEQLDVLAQAGVVDAGGYGLLVILAGVVAALREDHRFPEVAHHTAARVAAEGHASSRYRWCVNFVVSGKGLAGRSFVPALERLGDSVLVVGDERTVRVHVHTDDPPAARALFDDAGSVEQVEDADMRAQVAKRSERLAAGADKDSGVPARGADGPAARTAAVAVVAGDGLRQHFRALGAGIVDGGQTLNPSTSEIVEAIEALAAEEAVVLANSPNVILAAREAARIAGRPAHVVESTSQQAGLAALVELDPQGSAGDNTERLGDVLAGVRTGAVAPAARDDAEGRFVRGDAVGFAEGEIVAWGGAGSTLGAVLAALGEGAEIVTVFEGEGAPIALDELPASLESGAEVEVHRGGQPSYWWILAAQ